MKWFTSDLHFAHPFVAALRGYAKDASIKQQAEHEHKPLKNCVDWRKHDADIIRSINTYVGEEDELYILGDISSGDTWSVDQAIMRIQNLHVPRKNRHLILGNHELHSSSRTLEKLASVFGEVGQVGLTDITSGDGTRTYPVLLSHYQWREDFKEAKPKYQFSTNWNDPNLAKYALPRMDNTLLLHGHTHAHDPLEFGRHHNEINVGLDAWCFEPVTTKPNCWTTGCKPRQATSEWSTMALLTTNAFSECSPNVGNRLHHPLDNGTALRCPAIQGSRLSPCCGH